MTPEEIESLLVEITKTLTSISANVERLAEAAKEVRRRLDVLEALEHRRLS